MPHAVGSYTHNPKPSIHDSRCGKSLLDLSVLTPLSLLAEGMSSELAFPRVKK